MPDSTLSLKTLHLLSDGLAEDFEQQLVAAVQDCRQRPALAKRREVTIKLIVTPHPEDPDDVLIEPVTTSKRPARHVDPVRARRSRNDQLQFTWIAEED